MLDKFIDLLISLFDSFKPIIFILEYKRGVMFRAGKFLRTLEPGWHVRIPFVDTVYSEVVMHDTMPIKEVNITTLDGKAVSASAEFDLEVKDIYLAVVETNDWRSNLLDIDRGIISDQLEDRTWDEIRKKTTKNAIEKLIQRRAVEMGVHTSNFNFTDKIISRAFKLFNT